MSKILQVNCGRCSGMMQRVWSYVAAVLREDKPTQVVRFQCMNCGTAVDLEEGP